MSNERNIDNIQDTESTAIANREEFEKSITNLWGHSQTGLEAKRAAMTMLSTKTGMYAKVPIRCKADSCPYSDSCQLLPYDLAPIGEFCPIETAQIELRFQGYAEDFDIDSSSFTDKCIISEIINCDIMMERCKALMAKEGDPVIQVVAGVSEEGTEYYRPEVSRYWEAYDKAMRRRNENYQLMVATRRDKKSNGEKEVSITQVIASAFEDGTLDDIEEVKPDHLD